MTNDSIKNLNKKKLPAKNRRCFKGVVVSNTMMKTVVVKVERIKELPKYQKKIKVSRKFKCHDEKNQFKIGDRVMIEECRPVSKDKKWRVINKIEIIK